MSFLQKAGKCLDFKDPFVRKIALWYAVLSIIGIILLPPLIIALIVVYPIYVGFVYSSIERQAAAEKKPTEKYTKEAAKGLNWWIAGAVFLIIALLFTPLIFLSPVILIGLILIIGFRYVGHKVEKKK